MRGVPDTSVIIEGLSSKLTELKIEELIVPEAVLAELEHQSNQGKISGYVGLKEIEKLREILKDNLRFSGVRPKASEIKYAHLGEMDNMIRELAYSEDATLLTGDKTQYHVAIARGIKAVYIEKKQTVKKLKMEKYFDENTMSVHLREDVVPVAKRGRPGEWSFEKLANKSLTQKELKEISSELIEEANARADSFIEIEREGSTIVQLGRFRTVITRQPFSDGMEITAVRPVKHLSIDEYELSEKLKERITQQAEGILIAGSPGMGKSTFAAALIETYAGQGRIVKTIEAPRDLVLPPSVTQYAISHGSGEEIHDILLLSRPDNTLFDEMRNRNDFELYADLRLAGIGLAGVIHGTTPIDAIHRFIGKLELGIIPQVVDTVIFIKHGRVDTVLSLEMHVKVPSGMTESDLARPVIVITDFESNTPMYEIYTYGEQTVVVPFQQSKKDGGVSKIVKKGIQDVIKKYTKVFDVEVLSDDRAAVYIPPNAIPGIIGKKGETIARIEQELGISLDIRELDESQTKSMNRKETKGKGLKFDIHEDKTFLKFEFNKQLKNKPVTVLVDDEYVMNGQVGKKAILKVSKKQPLGKILLDAIIEGKTITIVKD